MVALDADEVADVVFGIMLSEIENGTEAKAIAPATNDHDECLCAMSLLGPCERAITVSRGAVSLFRSFPSWSLVTAPPRCAGNPCHGFGPFSSGPL